MSSFIENPFLVPQPHLQLTLETHRVSGYLHQQNLATRTSLSTVNFTASAIRRI